MCSFDNVPQGGITAMSSISVHQKWTTSGADCIMFGLTSSPLLCFPPGLSEYFGDFDTESLLIDLRVSSNLQMIANILKGAYHDYTT